MKSTFFVLLPFTFLVVLVSFYLSVDLSAAAQISTSDDEKTPKSEELQLEVSSGAAAKEDGESSAPRASCFNICFYFCLDFVKVFGHLVSNDWCYSTCIGYGAFCVPEGGVTPKDCNEQESCYDCVCCCLKGSDGATKIETFDGCIVECYGSNKKRDCPIGLCVKLAYGDCIKCCGGRTGCTCS